MRTALATLLLGLGLALGGPATGQQQGNLNVLVTGTILDSGPNGYDGRTTVSCRGFPTCTGNYSATIRYEGCTNYYTSTGTFNINNLNLARSGPLQGTIVVTDNGTQQLPGGACAPTAAIITETLTYTGQWNLDAGRGSLTVTGASAQDTFVFDFTADLRATPPVFPMTVHAQIGPQTATVRADIQFRPQDVGRSGSVFAFASAPAAIVQGGLAAKAVHLGFVRTATKAEPMPCVLSQMTAGGQLVAITASQMQAFLSGTLTAAGASVSILDGVPTSGVAGATFYVGYGPSGSTMLDDGIYRNAALVPGNSVCPMLPAQTALWWDPDESGWGLNLNHQGGLMFGTLFTYDAARAPLWLVMPAGAMQADGSTFTGDLYRTTGPAFNANPFTPIGPANITQVGSMTISFAEANAGTLRYTMNGVEVVKSIQRQVYGTRAANCLPITDDRTSSTHYQDLWWDPDESGWGLNLTHQDNTIFGTLFTYDAGGRGLWLVMPAGLRQLDGSYQGALYRTTGGPFNAIPFSPIGAADITAVGTMRVLFANGNSGTLTYTVDGVQVTKSITRQVFSTPAFTCN